MVMLANWMYLIVFLFIYFLSINTVQYVMGILQGIFTNFNGLNLWDDIPDSTMFLMNLLIYIIVPIGAIVWTILASKPREVSYAPY
jgi:hypothetical protein